MRLLVTPQRTADKRLVAPTPIGGWKIVKTMGTRITKVTPLEGMVAETAGAFTLYITEMLKIPVSTTHTITGVVQEITVGFFRHVQCRTWSE